MTRIGSGNSVVGLGDREKVEQRESVVDGAVPKLNETEEDEGESRG